VVSAVASESVVRDAHCYVRGGVRFDLQAVVTLGIAGALDDIVVDG
jgi:hypothetical protein